MDAEKTSGTGGPEEGGLIEIVAIDKVGGGASVVAEQNGFFRRNALWIDGEGASGGGIGLDQAVLVEHERLDGNHRVGR